jgi:hypothetical protein
MAVAEAEIEARDASTKVSSDRRKYRRENLRTGECRSGIFGTIVSSFLRESDLALEEARSDGSNGTNQ